ncbi:DUF4430 domain-containing protein [uncultured Eubacterium sp.]|uniref:DUF4430 domain-containing protein n=1 Tax=uncultured Eubacterium sp. TaxID=165185 RepID=UPI0025EB96C4|nr:DUF4430 domain-containing protein [uncultured Eubacterium sp.]
MKNKRLCTLLLTIAMCFCFVSCSGNTQTVDNNNLSTTSQTEAVTQAQLGEDTATTEAATTADKESTTAQSTSKAKNKNNKEKKNKTTVNLTTSKTTTKNNEPTVKDEISCTLNVECKSILNNMDKLKDGHSEYVPANGYIIKGYKYTAKAGFTAYDALKKACEDNGIKLTAKSSMYGTYVSGINNIDEFDCGSQSGWMYSINGNRPNVSASSQRVTDGDEITFEYVCEYQ